MQSRSDGSCRQETGVQSSSSSIQLAGAGVPVYQDLHLLHDNERSPLAHHLPPPKHDTYNLCLSIKNRDLQKWYVYPPAVCCQGNAMQLIGGAVGLIWIGFGQHEIRGQDNANGLNDIVGSKLKGHSDASRREFPPHWMDGRSACQAARELKR